MVQNDRFFAQLVNSGGADRSGALDDWVRIEHQSDGTNIYWLRTNSGGGVFADHVKFDVGFNCDAGPTYWFADFNNDGLDDFFCIGGGSQITVSLNRGGNPPTFESIGQVGILICARNIKLTETRWFPRMMVMLLPTSVLQTLTETVELTIVSLATPATFCELCIQPSRYLPADFAKLFPKPGSR
jgi:hypothetical protein